MIRKTFLACLIALGCGSVAQAVFASPATEFSSKEEKEAEIKFDTLRINLGTFSEAEVQHCEFQFANVGDAPLIINQAFASCGCTVPSFPKEAIKPGARGSISVTYNGKGKFPGHFSKTVTVRTNASNAIVRLTIEGMMTAAK